MIFVELKIEINGQVIVYQVVEEQNVYDAVQKLKKRTGLSSEVIRANTKIVEPIEIS